MKKSSEYKIEGNEIQHLEFVLEPGDSILAEQGSLIYMEADIKMEPVIGGSVKKTLVGSVISAGLRLLSGENIFLIKYTNEGQKPQKMAISSSMPGKIVCIDLKRFNGEILAQKGSFLCSDPEVEVKTTVVKKISSGFFGGEGFLLQHIQGKGRVFVCAGGNLIERKLEAGEKIKVETGNLAFFEKSVKYDVKMLDLKNQLFGGSGLFLTELTGPGTVFIQTYQSSKLINEIVDEMTSNLPSKE